MSYPTKSQVPVASHNRTKLNLSSQHITTADFMQFNVAKILHLVPGQSVNLQHMTFSRLEPMPVPTFGRARIQNRAYFVPFRTVWSAWNDFINDTPHSYDDGDGAVFGIPSVAPFFRTQDLIQLFTQSPAFAVVPTNSEEITPDFVFGGLSADGVDVINPVNYVFTELGRWSFKFLRSLGYGLTFAADNVIDYTQRFSALPLMCAAKVYCDFYFPAQYAQTQVIMELQRFFTLNVPETSLSDTWFDYRDLQQFFTAMFKISYSSDYFTSAWDNPVSPNDNLQSNFAIPDITNHYLGTADFDTVGTLVDSRTNGVQNGTPVIRRGNTDTGVGAISDYSLTALKSLTDYIKRNQIVGSRALDRYLARYGFNLTAEKLNRCIKISEYAQDIQFGDVTSTADSAGANLGSFAGKGVSYGNGSFDFETVEHGCLIIISTIIPDIGYYQGVQRSVLHLDKADFWIPEFDNLGVQAISKQELYVPYDAEDYLGLGFEDTDSVEYGEQIFGFSPRYSEYKIPYSQITGDYVLKSRNVGKDSWNLFRDVRSAAFGPDITHSLNFVLANDKDQYNRIFYNTENTADHFNIIHDFNITSIFPGKGVFDTYEFDDEDKSPKVTMDVGGLTDN